MFSEKSVEITGEVLAADLKNHHCQVWLDQDTAITVEFSPEQEQVVTRALKEHMRLRLRVKGKGHFSADGQLFGVAEVEEMEVRAIEEAPYDPSAPTIGEILGRMAAEVPPEEWDKLPSDLSENLDHYLYGTPKR